MALLSARAARRPWLAPALALLLGCFPALLVNAASAMSEQLFFCLGFAGLLALIPPGGQVSARRAVLAALLVGLAALTRYMGAAFIAAGVWLYWLAAQAAQPRRRLARAALFALGASLPLLLWLAWTLFATQTVGARTLNLSPVVIAARASEFFQTNLALLSAWVPYGARGAGIVSAPAKLILLLLVWAAAAAWAWRTASSPSRRLFLAGLVFSLAYLLFLALSYLFASIPPDLIQRMVSPLWPAACLALLATALMLAEALARRAVPGRWAASRFVPALPYAAMVLIVLVNLVYFAPQISELSARGHDQGVGYTARVYRDSPAFAQIRFEMSGRPLISDEPALLLLYTGRGAYSWEAWIQGNLRAAAQSPLTGQGDSCLDKLLRSGAALVIFPLRVEEEYGPGSQALLDRWTQEMKPLYNGPEAEVFIISRSP
jgi:4-amino-4-deoxy-L-arabinose transferase-like glycosyltransferase